MITLDYLIGIDNGAKSGGIAILDGEAGTYLHGLPLDVTEANGVEIVDVVRVSRWIRTRVPDGARVLALLEQPLEHAKSSQAIGSMERCFGALAAALTVLQSVTGNLLTWQPVPCGNRLDSWQRIMLPAGEDTKKAALGVARELWPEERWLPTTRHRTPHQGIVDAALIAACRRFQLLGEKPWRLESAAARKRKQKLQRPKSALIIGS